MGRSRGKNTRNFLNLEKRNASNKIISQLQLTDNMITEDPKVILKEERKFYENLYSEPGRICAIQNFQKSI